MGWLFLGSTTRLAGQWHRGEGGRMENRVINWGLCLWPEMPNRVKGHALDGGGEDIH